MINISNGSPGSFTWLQAGGTYLGLAAIGHTAWEIVQLPLYTIWANGTLQELAFAIVHCTIGDILIALGALLIALMIAGRRNWPRKHFWQVAIIAISVGIIYTAYSEWLNVTVRKSWAYSEWMPAVSLLGVKIGLSPMLQWIVVPGSTFLITKRVFDRTKTFDPHPK